MKARIKRFKLLTVKMSKKCYVRVLFCQPLRVYAKNAAVTGKVEFQNKAAIYSGRVKVHGVHRGGCAIGLTVRLLLFVGVYCIVLYRSSAHLSLEWRVRYQLHGISVKILTWKKKETVFS